jgi:hypothetical protein
MEVQRSVDLAQGPALGARFKYSRDREHREVASEIGRSELNALPWLRLHAEGGHGSYDEPHLKLIEATVVEVGATAHLRDALELEGAVSENWFGGARDAPGYRAGGRFRSSPGAGRLPPAIAAHPPEERNMAASAAPWRALTAPRGSRRPTTGCMSDLPARSPEGSVFADRGTTGGAGPDGR